MEAEAAEEEARAEAERRRMEEEERMRAEEERRRMEEEERMRLEAEAAEAERMAAEKARMDARDAAASDAKALLDASEFDAAIEVVNNAIAADAALADDDMLVSLRAEAIQRKADGVAARKMEAENRELNFLLTRAKTEVNQGSFASAIKTLNYGLELFPGNAELTSLLNQVNATVAKRNAGSNSDIEAPLSNTIEEFEREAESIFQDAQAKYDNKQYSESAEAYRKLLELIDISPYKKQLRDRYEAKAKAGLNSASSAVARERERNNAELSLTEKRLQELKEAADQKRRQDQIVELWRQVLFNMEVKRFNDAEDLVRTILDIDPNFRAARELQSQIQELRLQNIRRDTYERKMQGWRNAIIQIREAMTPNTDIVTYPTGALVRRIVERRNYLPDFAALDPGEVRMRNALEATVMSLESDPDSEDNKLTLREAIANIASKSNVHILFAGNDDTQTLSEEVLNINVQNLSARKVLSILQDTLQFEEVYSENVLFIRAEGSGDEADEARKRREVVTRVHDVRDITYQLKDFPGPVLNLRSQDETLSISPPREVEEVGTDEIIEFVMGGVRGEEFWAAPNVVHQFGGQLVVTAAPVVQAEVRDFLREMRAAAGLMVAMEARFIEITDNYLSDFGIDFRGLGGPSAVPNQANLILEDITGLPEDNAGGAFDNGSLGVPQLNPSAGIFFNNDNPQGNVNFNRDIRGRFENIFDNALGNQLSDAGGLAMQVAIFHNLTQINMVIRAVQKRGRGQTLVAPRLSAYNTQRSNIAIINQIPYIEDFQPQTAAGAGIANPIMDTILDGVVLEVVPTISNDRRFITLEVQPTIAELVFPIPTFVTTLGPTSAVTIQIPELRLQSARTTVRIPDGGAIVIGGLKTARDIDRESGTPILSDLPLIGVLFRRKGRSLEQSNLVIVIKANVIDLSDEELREPGYN
ncbi:MAG: hypothetical protein KDB07_04615, partial [Planctomycetes bacterium]|nr:hypothetical protein [Planctomycetota bacterium]